MSSGYELKEVPDWEADDDADDPTLGKMPFSLPYVAYVRPLGEGGQGKVVLVETKDGQAALKWTGVRSDDPDWKNNDMMVEARNLQVSQVLKPRSVSQSD